MDRHTIQIQQKIVNICRSLSTRRWDNKRKVWMIPENIYQELIKKLENENIDYIDKEHKKKITTYKST